MTGEFFQELDLFGSHLGALNPLHLDRHWWLIKDEKVGAASAQTHVS